MRIAHIVDALEVGGKEIFVRSLSRLHRAMGHDISIHCLDHLGPLGEELRAEGFSVPVHGKASRLTVMRRLRAALAGLRPDVVHCHNVQATVFGAPVIPSGCAAVSTRHNLISPPHYWPGELQYALALRLCCDRVATVCESARANLSRMPLVPRSRLVTVYNGADPAPPRFTAPAPVKEGFTFVHVSRLARPKDPETLLGGFALALAARPDLRLWIVGDGALLESSRALAGRLGLSQAATFFGRRADVGGFLSLADCFVLSSSSEGVPISQLEAMAAGLPMIVSRVGGMPEVLPEGDGFLTVAGPDREAWREAMLSIADTAERRPSRSETARRHYEQRFTMARMAEQYLQIYRELTAAA